MNMIPSANERSQNNGLPAYKKNNGTLSFIFGELGECHVSPFQVWQWMKQESINTPISFRRWNSLTAFSKEPRKPDNNNFPSYRMPQLNPATVVFESSSIEGLQKLIEQKAFSM